MESMKSLPSGAGKIPELNDVILGESLASEENDLLDANLIESVLWKFDLAVPNEFALKGVRYVFNYSRYCGVLFG
ncbi:hypothetical protein L2E82_15758 [Cichorium intybus]|uniref:Uncharacterized protein n=1 Tax=Cichorium intybus TaxID=13427 RepID=A0ACB9F4W0_CICIN|nr:hypothetical protein L2E82_15758 [Cichorium intybus]